MALVNGEIVGLGHLLSDGLIQAHLSLVGVLPRFRRQGIGRQLVSESFTRSRCRWLDLAADPGSEPFYRSFVHQERVGFRLYQEEPAA